VTIRVHPATTHGDRLHRLGSLDFDGQSWERIAWTWCGIQFAWGSWKGTHGPLPRCSECDRQERLPE